MKNRRRMFTKEEIKQILNLWESKTTDEIAAILNRPWQSIAYMATQMRKYGFKMPLKHRKHTINNLLQEVKDELEKSSN